MATCLWLQTSWKPLMCAFEKTGASLRLSRHYTVCYLWHCHCSPSVWKDLYEVSFKNAHKAAQTEIYGCTSDIFFFRALPQRRDKFLEHIVTGDETWVSNYKPVSNQQKSPGCNDIKCWVIKVHIREPQMWWFKFLNHCWKYRHVLEEWNVAKHVPYLGREITQKLNITMA